MKKDNRNLEIEVKIKIDNIPVIIKKISKHGFILIQKKYLETNIVFDRADHFLRKNKFLLRLRNQDTVSFLTFKRPIFEQVIPSYYKSREEIELKVSSFENMKKILLLLDFHIFFIYEKYREVYQKKDVKIMVDNTPIGNFIEIEGKKEKIDDTARLLGYEKNQYIVESYYTLFKKTQKTGFMVFK